MARSMLESMDKFFLENHGNGDGRSGISRHGEDHKVRKEGAARFAAGAPSFN
jgi:hypothetical protein